MEDNKAVLQGGGALRTFKCKAAVVRSHCRVERNDVDPEDNDMLVSLVSGPTSGTLVLNDDGTFSYTPDPTTVFQTDSFTYVATDILGAQSAAATVTFTAATLIPVPDTYLLSEAQNLQVSAADGLLANDVDTNTNFTIDSVWVDTNPKYGTLSLTWSDGSFAYQHDGSENRVDSFEYKVKNSNGDMGSAYQSFNIPVKAGDYYYFTKFGNTSVNNEIFIPLECAGGSSNSGNMVISTFGDTLTMNGQSIIVPGISVQNFPSSLIFIFLLK